MLLRTVRRLCLGNSNFYSGFKRAVSSRCLPAANHRGFRGTLVWGVPISANSRCRSATHRVILTSGIQRRSCDNNKKSSPFMLAAAAAFSLFSKLIDKDDEGLTESEKNIVYLLKTAKLSIMKGEMEEAEDILHKTLHLAQECDSTRAITYTYDLMANLAFLRGNYESKSYSRPLWCICWMEVSNRKDLAVAGFQFCILSLDEKIEKEKDLPEEVQTAEERKNTRLLLGLCLDSYARYLVANKQLVYAQTMYEKALQICIEEQGELHPQTVTLLSDLASVMEAQGHYDEAYAFVNQALGLAEKIEHPNHHVILSNLAMILMHQGSDHLADTERIFKQALAKAEEKKDSESIQYIKEGLSEVARRQEKNKTQNT
ncbi:tetratricopeptide repeat protein 19, mitochondrial isoform X2 [Pseudophryne corroboree]|uniref:tetratricopeptide repeat protein 19, mitochondrial isoform X2 n=1 Tax=Pseudophryne corroboree TaxID=495146 RepID=UPI003081BEF6